MIVLFSFSFSIIFALFLKVFHDVAHYRQIRQEWANNPKWWWDPIKHDALRGEILGVLGQPIVIIPDEDDGFPKGHRIDGN